MIDEKIASTRDNLYQQINGLELEQNQKIKLYTLLTYTESQFVVEKDQSLPFQRLAQAEFTIQQISLIFHSFDGSNKLNALIQFITPFPDNPQPPIELLRQTSFTNNQIICILEDDKFYYHRLNALKDSFALMPDSQHSFLQGLIKAGLTSEEVINFSKYSNSSYTLKALANLLNSSIPELALPNWLKTLSNLASRDFSAPGIVFLTNILLDNKLRQVLTTHSHFKALCSEIKYKKTNQLKKLTFDSAEDLLLLCENKIAKRQKKPTILKKRDPLNFPSPDCKKQVLAPTIELIKALKQMRDNNVAELFHNFEDSSFLKNKKTRSTMKTIMGITFRKTKSSTTGYTIKVIEKKTLYSWLEDNEAATHILNQEEIEQRDILENQGDSTNLLESDLFLSAFDLFDGVGLPESPQVDPLPESSQRSNYPLFFTNSLTDSSPENNEKDKKTSNLNAIYDLKFFSSHYPPTSPEINEAPQELDDWFIDCGILY